MVFMPWHLVDDSGRWGRGGLFTALENRSDEPRKQYERAGKMKDLELGSVLLFPVDDKQSRLDGQDQVSIAEMTKTCPCHPRPMREFHLGLMVDVQVGSDPTCYVNTHTLSTHSVYALTTSQSVTATAPSEGIH
uniref:Uncharacterized protein n=1 Tax=Hucho hucho TaxID=62062 RepID=A0A4W5L3R5_9TELE